MSPRPCPHGPTGDCAPPPVNAIAIPEGMDPASYTAGHTAGWIECVNHVSSLPETNDDPLHSLKPKKHERP